MGVREATVDDHEAIGEIANRSLETSYSLSPATIESAVEEWYGPEAFAERLEDDDTLVFVAEDDGETAAFSESVVTEGGQGDLQWLHVRPDRRGQGIGTALFEHTRERLEEAGANYLRGRVLADNHAGVAFYKKHGFEKVDETTLDIDGDAHVEYVLLDAESEQLRSVVTDDGEVVYVDQFDEEIGSEAPFNTVYTDPARTDRYGYYCTNCEALATTMDSMGRMRCPACGNTRKPVRWDASYM